MRALARAVLARIAALATPAFAAAVCLLLAFGLTVAGVHELAGRGWAFLAAGMMLAYPGIVLVRGLTRGGQ